MINIRFFIPIILLLPCDSYAAEQSEIDDIAERLTAIEQKLDALQLITSTIEAMESFSNLASRFSADEPSEDQATEKPSLDFFDVEIFDRQIDESFIYNRVSWEAKITAARIKEPVRAAKGAIVFYDLFDAEQMRIAFTLNDSLRLGQSVILKDRMHKDSGGFDRGYSWVSTTDPDDMKVAFDVSEIIYLDEAQEQRRQLELAEAQRQQESQDRERQRQEEATNAAAAELASSEFEMVQSNFAIIQQAVQSVWSRPYSARNGMRAILQIRMLPTGELIDALISESSGDPAFDRSAENAVYNAAPFRELQALPSNVFNENFRSLSLIFQ